MPRRATPLNTKQINAAKPRDKDYALYDGDGLQLRVRRNGSKLWNFNYTHPVTKKRLNLGLGVYPTVGLAEARKKTQEARILLAEGIDPKEQREQRTLQHKALYEHTVNKVASEWFKLKAATVTAPYADDIWRSLELHIFPTLGNTPISLVTAPQVIDALRPLEAKGSLETVKRLTQRLNELMTYAVNAGLISSNPLSGIRAVFQKPQKEHMPALKPEELPELMSAIANAGIKKVTRCLIEWQLHTMTRPSEAAGLKWDEIDFESRVWTIPAERMKRRRAHSIPLTDQALTILETIRPLSDHRQHVFPSDKNPRTHCNSQTANMALKRMGFAGRLVSHGLRSIASTTLNEAGFDQELIEVALAHVDSNEVRRAYNRTDYLERRRPMMVWWSNHIDAAAQGSLSVTGFKGFKVVSAG